MKLSSRQILSQEIADWHHRGIISNTLHDLLQTRYDPKGAFLASLLKWLGIFALTLLSAAVMTFIEVATNSAVVGAMLVGGVALLAATYGAKLAQDPLNQHPVIASILVTVSLACMYAAIVLFRSSAIDPNQSVLNQSAPFYLTPICITAMIGIVFAYTYRLAWPLFVSLLLVFHWVGAWQQYVGSGTYVFDIQDPKAMALFSLLVIGGGVYHERSLETDRLKTHVGFGHLYIIIGLLYLNMSVWIQSITDERIDYVILFGLVSIIEIVLGARLKDGRFTGYGVVFLSINFYTRFFENFWNETEKGFFFLLGGVGALLLGFIFETQLRKVKAARLESTGE